MPLRILHVYRTAESDAGRSAEAICELAVGQRPLGHEIEFVTFSPESAGPLEAMGFTVHRLPKGWGAYGLSRIFVRWIRAHVSKYDCVLVHGVWSFSAIGTWWALRKSTTPFFIFTHGNLDPWIKLHRPIRHLLSWFFWPWGAYPVLRDAHAVFFVCDNERQRARETFWLYDCHEFVVRTGAMGIPSTGLSRSAFQATRPALRDRRLFLFFADHDPVKGMLSLLGALELLTKAGSWNQDTMAVVVAGMGADSASLSAKRAERLGLSRSVFWAGPLTEVDYWQAVRGCEVMVRPSSFEICGKRVAEALSAGTPVLVSTGVATWKDVVNSGAGFADEADAEGLGRMLGRWIALTESERNSMRDSARKCFEERFSLDGAALTLTSAIYLLIGVHRDGRWDMKPLKPASELL